MALPEWVTVQRRKNPRAKGFNYATPGMYMLTQCVQNRLPLLSKVVAGRIELTGIGRLVESELLATAARFADTEIDCCCIMPDHLHLILALSIAAGKPGTSLIRFMQVFKSISSRRYQQLRREGHQLPESLFQRSYGDEVIEDEDELYAYRKYILENPQAFQLKKDGYG